MQEITLPRYIRVSIRPFCETPEDGIDDSSLLGRLRCEDGFIIRAGRRQWTRQWTGTTIGDIDLSAKRAKVDDEAGDHHACDEMGEPDTMSVSDGFEHGVYKTKVNTLRQWP